MEEEDNDPVLTPILPRDVMLLILCRLPVKSLVKFRCVKKSWYGVVKDPRLVKLHFDHYSKPEKCSFIAIGSKGFWRKKSEFLVIRPGSSKPEKLRLREPHKVCIVGSSNGLICLTYMNPGFGFEFKVMNPAIREQYRHVYTRRGLLHKFDHGLYQRYCTCVGFGFDKKSRDYKIFRVEVIQLSEPQWPTRVYIYSLRSDSWKTIQTPQNMSFDFIHLCMVTLGSCLYSLSYLHYGGKSITGFDLSSETFHTIPPPESRNLDCKQIAAWKNESLAAIFLNRERNSYEMWTISPGKTPINKDSWKMKTSFHFPICDGIKLPFSILLRLRHEGINDFPIVCRHKKSYSLLYLNENRELAKLISSCQTISCHRESLVPLFSVQSSVFY